MKHDCHVTQTGNLCRTQVTVNSDNGCRTINHAYLSQNIKMTINKLGNLVNKGCNKTDRSGTCGMSCHEQENCFSFFL